MVTVRALNRMSNLKDSRVLSPTYNPARSRPLESFVLDRLEQAFAVTESAAEAARKSATFVVSQTRALVKAAQTGNIAAIKRTQDRLRESAMSLQQDIDAAATAWSLTDDEEQGLFEEQFAELLQNAAEELGLNLYELDGFFISYPSIV